MTEVVDPPDQAEMIEPMTEEIVDHKQLAERLLAQVREQNIELSGLAAC